MRKIIVSMNVSLDGLMAGPDEELDWHFERWTTDMAELLSEQLSRADTILLGKNTYSVMANYWPRTGNCPSFPREDIAYAAMMNNHTKVVFSQTMTSLPWSNSRVIRGDLRRQVLKLKKEPGRDIMIYGSGKLVSALLRMSLIDEYNLWVHPVALGRGRRLFSRFTNGANIKLTKMRHFRSGVTLLNYRVNGNTNHPGNNTCI